MAGIDSQALERALDRLPLRFKGPGGVAGVVLDGQVIARRAWGYADTGRAVQMTRQTRLPICSVTKQFTCAALLDVAGDPAPHDPLVAAFLPNFTGPLPTLRQLCANQSGLRDYWALTVLQGAFPEQPFGRADAGPLLATLKTGHFAPGTSYSYANNNFRIVGDVVEQIAGRPLGAVLSDRIFGPAGMTTAALIPDTATVTDGVIGYEGNDQTGFLPAQNAIYWAGDAGISASLDDMLAWECHIDATRDDPGSLYNRLCAPPQFSDGQPASYGFGIRHDLIAGRPTTGHGGALRGFRAHRRHMASERLSVVVMFNHEQSAHGAVTGLFHAALGHNDSPKGPAVGPDWIGLWLDDVQGTVVQTEADPDGASVLYDGTPLELGDDGVARGDGCTLQRDGDGLVMTRADENLTQRSRPLVPLDWACGAAIAGRYHAGEVQAELHITWRDGAAFARFDGHLGLGPVERMYPVAADVWAIATRRSMDAPAPGDWTVLIHRDGAGQVSGLRLGCWLARNIVYTRL